MVAAELATTSLSFILPFFLGKEWEGKLGDQVLGSSAGAGDASWNCCLAILVIHLLP